MKLKEETPDKNVDDMLNQLELLDTQFKFYVTETEKLDKQALALAESQEDITPEGCKKLDNIMNKIEELFVRYQKDAKIYETILARVNKHFKDKYNIDLGL
jgi:archaellum component FlaC